MVTSCHTKACFDAWMNCEDLLVNINQVQRSLSRKITRIVDECALICMTTFHALKSHSVNTGKYALLCVGICEECAEVCEQLNDKDFKRCALVCRECSDTLSQLISISPEQVQPLVSYFALLFNWCYNFLPNIGRTSCAISFSSTFSFKTACIQMFRTQTYRVCV